MLHISDSLQNCEYINNFNEHRTHVDGHWYKKPDKFPCVLHDKNGCIFLTKEKYLELVYFRVFIEYIGHDKITFDVKNGISNIKGYTICSQKKSCLKYNPKNMNSQKGKKQKAKIDKLLEQFLKLPPDQQVALKKQWGMI